MRSHRIDDASQPESADSVRRVRGPYAKSALTRDRILDACEQIFAEKGFLAATAKEVAIRAGISERGLVHHFASKEDLLAGVLDRHEERTAAAMVAVTGLEALEALLEQERLLEQQPGIVELQVLLNAESTSRDHPAHKHFASRYRSLHEYLTGVLIELADSGRLSTAMSPDEVASSFIGLADGLHLQWLYDQNRPLPSSVLRAFLGSIIPDLRSTADSDRASA